MGSSVLGGEILVLGLYGFQCGESVGSSVRGLDSSVEIVWFPVQESVGSSVGGFRF